MSSVNKTLYLVQSDYDRTPLMFEQIAGFYDEYDALVLMGDAVLHYQDPRLSNIQQLYVLQSEVDLLVIDQLPQHIKLLTPAEFADVILDFRRCITLK